MDINFLKTLEDKIDLRDDEREDFRNDMITKLGVVATDQGKILDNYCEIFHEDIYLKLKSNFVESQRKALEDMAKELDYYRSGEESDKTSTINKLLKNLREKYKYSEETALKLISFVYRS